MLSSDAVSRHSRITAMAAVFGVGLKGKWRHHIVVEQLIYVCLKHAADKYSRVE